MTTPSDYPVQDSQPTPTGGVADATSAADQGFGFQATPGQFNHQQTPGQFGQNPGQFDQPQFGQTPGQFGQSPFNQFGQAPGQFNQFNQPQQYNQPGFGGWQRSSRSSGSGPPFGLRGLLFGFGRGGRYSKLFWTIRIIAILIALGVFLYTGFVNHHWVFVCHTGCGDGGD